MTSARVERGKQFVEKAHKLLHWSEKTLEEMIEHGTHKRMEDFERVFWALLAQVSSLHESLDSASAVLGMTAWKDELDALRKDDMLLRWLWLARNSETHDAIANRAMQTRLLFFIHGVSDMEALQKKAKGGVVFPDPRLVAKAGLELEKQRQSLSLVDFGFRLNGKTVRVKAPTRHLAKNLPPDGVEAIRAALEFYRGKATELTQAAL
jgi:hypothetical protein